MFVGECCERSCGIKDVFLFIGGGVLSILLFGVYSQRRLPISSCHMLYV